MNLESRIREELSARARSVAPSSDAWSSLQRKATRRGRTRGRRVVTAAIALVAFGGAFFLLWTTFRTLPLDQSVGSATEVSAPHLGATIPVSGVRAVIGGSEGVWGIGVGIGVDDAPCAGISGRAFPVDTDTNQVAGRVQLDFVPEKVVEGFGSVWVAGYTCTPPATSDGLAAFHAVVARIDPTSGEVIAQLEVGPGEAFGLASGEQGIWVASGTGSPSSGQLVRIDPASNEADLTVDLHESVRQVEASGSDIWVWALGRDVSQAGILRVDGQTGSVHPASVGELGGPLAADSGGVWAEGVVGSGASPQASAVFVSKETGQIDRSIPVPFDRFVPFATSQTGVWFIGGTDSGADSVTVGHLDVVNGQVDASLLLPTSRQPDFFVLDPARSAIWLTSESQGLITRIDL